MAFELLIRGGTVWLPEGARNVDVAVIDGRIAALGAPGVLSAATVLDAHGLHVLPGVIDTHVHFREPGMEHKEDLATGSQAAVLGGVTAVCEMPNTIPATTTAKALTDKLDRAQGRMACDYAFFLGATADNVDSLAMWEQMAGCAGVKIFMGKSTGTLLVEDNAMLSRILSSCRRRVAVHCEDESRLRERHALVHESGLPTLHALWRDAETAFLATKRILKIARKLNRKIHILHVSTQKEISLLMNNRDIATFEITPHHLTLSAPECYYHLGTLSQVNPPIRAKYHQDALWTAVNEGLVDCLGSDHAPHTLAEKAKLYPTSPSGIPGVQTLVPVMLTHIAAGRLSLAQFVALTSAGPARLYAIAAKGYIAVGFDADFTIVDLKARRTIDSPWLASRCGWSPFEGMTVTGFPIFTIIRGHLIMRDGCVLTPENGSPLRFQEV